VTVTSKLPLCAAQLANPSYGVIGLNYREVGTPEHLTREVSVCPRTTVSQMLNGLQSHPWDAHVTSSMRRSPATSRRQTSWGPLAFPQVCAPPLLSTLYALAALAACCCMPCCRLYHSLTIAACCCMPCCRLYHSLTIAAYYFRRIPKCACVWVECVRDAPSFSGLWSHVHACMWLPIRT